MSSTIQDRSITITHNGKAITWRPRDQIPPPPASTPALVEEVQAEVLPLHRVETEHKTKFKLKLKEVGKNLFRHNMAKRKHATKVFNVGVDTFSTTRQSFINRLKFWRSDHPKSPRAPCEGCRSWKTRFDPDVRNRSLTEAESNGMPENPLKVPSMTRERATHDDVQRVMQPSESPTPASAPILIPGTAKHSSCCSKRGQENQQDGNIGLEVKDAAFLNVSSVSEESMVNITIEDSPIMLSRQFSKSNDSLPEDGQYPSPERGCFSIHEESEAMSDLEISPSAERCTGLPADLAKVPDFISLDGPEIVCQSSVDLEVELKEAIESSLPQPGVVSETTSSPAGPASDKVENRGEGSEISLTGSFSRTRVSLSSNDGNSAPSHSFHIEKPYSSLGSDFVDVEDYLVQPSDSFPEPTYPALDSSATTEAFGFKPTCECMPGSWPGNPSQEFSEERSPTSKTWQDMSSSKIQRNSPDLRCPTSFFRSKVEVLKFLERGPSPQPDASLSFARCRPIPGSFRQSLPSPSLSQSTSSESTTSLHLRGGADPDRFNLLRQIGKGKSIGSVEHGKKLLNEQVSDCYFVGGRGQGGTWRELCEKMEKRVEKGKEIGKTEAKKEGEESGGRFKALLAWAKGWFDTGKEGEPCEEETGEAVITLAVAQPAVAC
jgi:hypothetical protein